MRCFISFSTTKKEYSGTLGLISGLSLFYYVCKTEPPFYSIVLDKKIADIRTDYTLDDLLERDVAPDPITQFSEWFDQALRAEVIEPNAMTLSTVSADGKPSSRIVLLKDVGVDGFSFFTNYHSRKGRELAGNPHASLLLFWPELQRQVRVEGSVSKLSGDVSTAYFRSRPRGSRIGAVASPQSEIVESRGHLDARIRSVEEVYAGQEEIPRPEHWGGYLLKPDSVEFWQGRSSRLHDRLCYRKVELGWQLIRLAP